MVILFVSILSIRYQKRKNNKNFLNVILYALNKTKFILKAFYFSFV